jgi:hypothetical protein
MPHTEEWLINHDSIEFPLIAQIIDMFDWILFLEDPKASSFFPKILIKIIDGLIEGCQIFFGTLLVNISFALTGKIKWRVINECTFSRKR